MESKKSSIEVLRSQRGQGTIEYLLILVFVVTIALGSIYKLNDAFGKFIDNYFGEYLACLLETGELPNLGASEGVGCDDNFEEFSFTAGRPPLRGNLGGEGEDQVGSERLGVRQDGEGGGQSGRSSRRANRGRLVAREAVDREAGNSGGAGNIAVKKGGNEDSGGREGGRPLKVPQKKAQTLGRIEIKKEDDEIAQRKKKSTREREESNQGVVRRDGRIPVKKIESEAKEVTIETPFTLGKFIRYLIISGIIIALVVFIGGQALQFSKEKE